MPSHAQSDWIAKKCALYAQAWSSAVTPAQALRLSHDFRAANENFITSGCTHEISVCPRSVADYETADMLTIIMLNEGAASTFLPFNCDDE